MFVSRIPPVPEMLKVVVAPKVTVPLNAETNEFPTWRVPPLKVRLVVRLVRLRNSVAGLLIVSDPVPKTGVGVSLVWAANPRMPELR